MKIRAKIDNIELEVVDNEPSKAVSTFMKLVSHFDAFIPHIADTGEED